MNEGHISDEDIKKFVSAKGPLKGKEFDEFVEFTKKVNGHIRGCKDCLEKVTKAQKEQDRIDGIEDEYITDRSKHMRTVDENLEAMGITREEIEAYVERIYSGPIKTIEMEIAKTAAKNWGQKEPQNLDEAKAITGGSEISSMQGIMSVLGLEPGLEPQFEYDLYYSDTISEDIAKEIQSKIERNGNSNLEIIDMLSVVHDEWVRNNSNNFLRVNKDENGNDKPRNKEYQFVPFQMLSWKEAKSDLLFLKPILEAAGVQVDEKAIEQQFEIAQKEFLIDNGIDSPDKLKFKIKQGSKFYPALEGLETKNGGKIDDLLKDDEILEKMTGQIESQINIRSREEMAVDLIKSDNKALNEMFWIQTVERDIINDEKLPFISEPASKREILLSKLIGKPYPTYFQGLTLPNYDRYENTINGSYGHESDIELAENGRMQLAREARESDDSNLDEKGSITFGYGKNAEIIPGKIEVSKRDLIEHQLNPEKMGYSEKTLDKKGKVSPKNIAKLDQEKEIRDEEVKGAKGFITNMLDKFKGKGEK